MKKSTILLLLVVSLTLLCHAQTNKTPGTIYSRNLLPDQSDPELSYFDFFEGTWYMLADGKADTTGNRFIIRKGINDWVFEEDWRMVYYDSGNKFVNKAYGVRAWNASFKQWSYVWMGEDGYFQVWDGKKVDGNWYIYKHFDINGDKYLSRQAWIPHASGKRLTRISEKSYDEGKTWQLRFKEEYEKVK